MAAVCNGAPTDVWPVRIPTDAASLSRHIASLGASAEALPSELAPAVEFEKVFLQILAGAPQPEWLPRMQAFAARSQTDPITQGLRELSKAWLARVEMLVLDDALKSYYAENVCFPEQLSALGNNLPEILRLDPWGEQWAYRARAAAGFSSVPAQRYQIGPHRYPELGTLREAITKRKPPATGWKISPRKVGESAALEFRSSSGTALIQSGGKIDQCALLFAGPDWALMAGADQLFAVMF